CAPCSTGKKCLYPADCTSQLCNDQFLISDSSWKQTQTFTASWTDLTFNDSSWPNAVEETAFGGSPWFNSPPMLPACTAQWIRWWDSRSSGDNSTVYFR